MTQKFFTLPNNASTELTKVATQLERQNNQFKFLLSFIETNGLPVWKNVLSNEALLGYRSNTQRNGTGSDSLMFFIPLQALTSPEISSYIVCLKTDTTYRFSLYRKNVLDTLRPTNEQQRKFNEGALSVFALFEKQINGIDSVFIKGIYQKHISQASLHFGSSGPVSAGGRSATFYAYGITTCYRISCTETPPHEARTAIGFDCYSCTTSWTVNWGSSNSSNAYWFDDGSGGSAGGGGGGGSSFSPTVEHLINLLNLTLPQAEWLSADGDREKLAVAILYYLQTTATDVAEAKQIAMQHINQMRENNWYLTFVQQHQQTALDNLVWWEDDTWLSDPDNFNIDIDAIDNLYYELTAAEKALVKMYPVQAAIMSFNKTTAENYTVSKMGTNGVNEKSDAFRHAFFQAINTIAIGQSITQAFSDAHESEVPVPLLLEKEMDLFNNAVGISVGQSTSFWTSVSSLGDMIKNKVDNGELRYLKPLNFFISPRYDVNRDKVQDCPTCRDGIIDSTVLTWTNQ